MKKRPECTVIPPAPRVEKSDLSPLLWLVAMLFIITVVLVKLP